MNLFLFKFLLSVLLKSKQTGEDRYIVNLSAMACHVKSIYLYHACRRCSVMYVRVTTTRLLIDADKRLPSAVARFPLQTAL